jgi:hypothetical protein
MLQQWDDDKCGPPPVDIAWKVATRGPVADDEYLGPTKKISLFQAVLGVGYLAYKMVPAIYTTTTSFWSSIALWTLNQASNQAAAAAAAGPGYSVGYSILYAIP